MISKKFSKDFRNFRRFSAKFTNINSGKGFVVNCYATSPEEARKYFEFTYIQAGLNLRLDSVEEITCKK